MLFFSKKKSTYRYNLLLFLLYLRQNKTYIDFFIIIREEIAMVKRVKKGHEQDDHEFDNVYNCDADERYDGVDSSIWYN